MSGMELSASADVRELMEVLLRRGVITNERADADTCCGFPRDEDGFCTYKPKHPIYVDRCEHGEEWSCCSECGCYCEQR